MAKQLFLSASRCDTFSTCSQLYAARYIYRLPDPGNDGSNRGSVTHEVLELLLKPRHRKRYDNAIQQGSCEKVPALWKLIKRFAARYKVCDPANLKMINGFIMVALTNDFFGPKGTTKVEGEKEFSIVVDRPAEGIRYAIRGYIDATYFGQDELGMWLSIKDIKTSKEKFSKDKMEYNMQTLMYQLALRHLYPEITRRSFHFCFVKFVKAPRVDADFVSDEELSGFELILTAMQKAVESFTLANAADNLAMTKEDVKFLCGREGFKKDGTKAFLCSARNPLDYFVLLSADGDVIESAFKEDDLKPKEGQIVVGRRYPGCPGYWNQTTGERINFA